MKTHKIYNLILITGVIGSFILSIIYLFKSYRSLQFDNTSFIFNTSILFSNITSLIILIYLMRRAYWKSKKGQGIFFSKYMLFGLLIYLTLPLEVITYNLYRYGMENFTFEKLTSFLFGIVCISVTVYMIKGKDLNNNVA